MAAYHALQGLQAEGLVRQVGVSNYTVEDFEELKASGVEEPPAMNQIEINPWLYRAETIAYFQKHGVHLQSYRGLAVGAKWEDPTLAAICAESGKTPPQVLGRWLVQHGFSHIPKSVNAERMAQNP